VVDGQVGRPLTQTSGEVQVRVSVITEPEIRELVGPADAVAAVRQALVQLARGEAIMPEPSEMDLADVRGDMHVKGAYLSGAPYFSYKAASGFYDNPARGLPVNAGLVLVFDAQTGFPSAILFDNGYLTDLRTGAAGAVAADLLARPRVGRVAILGAGVQARRQLEMLLQVRQPADVSVWARRPEQAAGYASEMTGALGVPVTVAESARAAVDGADIVVTTTPSREPLVSAAWFGPGQHITAVGADLPDKQELDPALFAAADKVVVDSLAQALRSGDTHHAVQAGLLDAAAIHAELGQVAAGSRPGREHDAELTIADLTGLGVQDAAMANLVAAKLAQAGAGQVIEI
jgi:ornithine cyclodeaminase